MARRFVGLAWLALLGAPIASPVLADDPPGKLLGETQERFRLARESLTSTVQSAISKAGKLPADAALIVLQSAENDVNEAQFLTADEKKNLLAQLAAKKKGLDAAGMASAPTTPARKPSQEEMKESEFIREEINIIKALEKAGNGAQAQSRLKALQARYPNNQTLLAFATVNSRQGTANDVNRLKSERAANEGNAFTDLDKSAGNVPPNGAMSYDKKTWDKASKRSPVGSVANNLTSKEKEYLKVLDQNSKTDFNLNETSFTEIMKMLEQELGFALVISKATMEEVRITYESKLTYQIPKGVSKRTLLKSVLAELGLTYIIKGELVQVVSFVQAKNEVRVGVMDVATIVRSGTSTDDLIKLIKATIEPDSWDTSGGIGTITIQPPATLIIKNSAEVIYRLGARPK